jgi:hypothetical protein
LRRRQETAAHGRSASSADLHHVKFPFAPGQSPNVAPVDLTYHFTKPACREEHHLRHCRYAQVKNRKRSNRERRMGYKFDILEFQSIGNIDGGSRRVVLLMSFQDTDGLHDAELEVEISVPDTSNATAAEIQASAFRRAKTLVATAADVLSRGDLATLKSATNPHD